MDVAFILHIRVQDVSTLADEAAAIQDDLESAGHDVVSVTPWSRPTVTTSSTLSPFAVAPPPTEPPTPL